MVNKNYLYDGFFMFLVCLFIFLLVYLIFIDMVYNLNKKNNYDGLYLV